jgi:hypothetical protein
VAVSDRAHAARGAQVVEAHRGVRSAFAGPRSNESASMHAPPLLAASLVSIASLVPTDHVSRLILHMIAERVRPIFNCATAVPRFRRFGT